MVDRLNVGVIGCGSVSEAHLRYIAKRQDVNLLGFCDVDLQRAVDKAKRYGSQDSKTYTDFNEMFSSSLDAVFIFVPPFARGAELKAAERLIPFFVEKPVEINMDRAIRILQKVRETDVITSVGYMNRYQSGVNVAKEEFRQDPVILALGGWIGSTPRNDNWIVIKSMSGGQLHEQVTHTVDLIRYICGEVKEVHAYCAHGFNKGVPKSYDVEDASVVNMKLDHGGVVNIFTSCSSNSYGGIFLNIYAYGTAAIFTGWEHSLKLFKVDRAPAEFKGNPDVFEIEDNAFIDAVREGNPSKIRCTYEDGVQTLAVTLTANSSMECGMPLKVPRIYRR